MHFIEMVTWLVGLLCYRLSNESNTLNSNIAVNNVKYINANYCKYDCASFSTYVKGNLSWFVEWKQYTVCVYFKRIFWTAFLNLSLWLQVGMLVCNYLSEEMLISLCIPLFLGMLPLLGSSTSDPEEELEELRMKLQIMKGEWKNAVKLTLMVKLNQECY